MEYRNLGRSDVRVSAVALGTWGLSTRAYGAVDPSRLVECIDQALDEGITTFDMAPVWGDGAAEEKVGERLSETEASTVVVTRAGMEREGTALLPRFEPDALVAACEASLKRLKREQIDVWLLHNPGVETLRDEAGWRPAVDRLAEGGKIALFGVSVGDLEEARLALALGAEVICVPYNILWSQMLEDLTVDLKASGAGVLARSPLAYGLLSGHWSEGRGFAADDHRSRRWSPIALAERLRQVDRLRFLVGADHPDLATAAIRYVLSHAMVSSALVGARAPHQVIAAAAAAKEKAVLSDDERIRLEKVRQAGGF